MGKHIHITQPDYLSLRSLISSGKYNAGLDAKYLGVLEAELRKAIVVKETEIPADIVTMNSIVCVKNMETGSQSTYKLVFPEKADLQKGFISILAPIGTALIGEKTGDIVGWNGPSGKIRLKIIKIIYQPEAAKDHNQTFNISD
ncbi:MAG TPA: GreA/GreB family elongation factor [Elusimicrobiales bacterium]|nr:GreA/GreB family elongation factor [Elusimicrobiales bacterium]